jgi:putative ABC transport system permease protein
MILLRLLSWQYVKKHPLRWALTTAGIVLGVAVFVGMHEANQSVLASFSKTVDRIAGTAQLQISAGEAGFEESVLERVQSIPEVATAAPVIEAVANTGIEGQGNLLILGVDMTSDHNLRDYDFQSGEESVIDDPLVFLAQPDSIILSDTFARQNGFTSGSRLPLKTMAGEKQFAVRGIMKSGGLASAFGGNLAVMDIYAAQQVFGRGRHFDRIDIGVKDGVSVEQCRMKVESALGPGFQVDSPAARGSQFESLTRVYAMSANVTSAFSLFIGMFIIFNTFSIAVAQRRKEIGILRALGATRGQIRAVFLGESAVAGLLGSCAGIALGLWIAGGIAGFIGRLLDAVYGVAQRGQEVSADPKLIAGALAIGIATSLVAAIIPARSAARIDPVRALQKGASQMFSSAENRSRGWMALAATIAALVCLLLRGWTSAVNPAAYLGFGFTVLAALLSIPAFTRWLLQALRPLLRAILPVEGTLAADSLLQAPRRTSGAVPALMLSVALVIALGGIAQASYSAITGWLKVAFNPDLFVATSDQITARSYRFPAEVGATLAAIGGVEEVQSVRSPRVMVGTTPVMVIAVEAESAGRRVPLPAVAGREDEMYRLTAQGKGVIASENLALLRGLKLGDLLDISSPDGVLHTPVVGIIRDYSDQQGSILMDRAFYIQHWHDDSVNIFRLYLKKDASAAAVKRDILDRLAGRYRTFVLGNAELRRYILQIADQWFGVTYLQIAVAVFIAVLGIVNTLTVSIADRRRELGVIQAIGGLRFQIRRTIWMEAVSIGTVGLILGLLLGAAGLYYGLRISQGDVAGLTLDYEFPFGIAALLLPVILGSAMLSSIGPAEVAVRSSLVESLEYE